jgi:hypothetical protein
MPSPKGKPHKKPADGWKRGRPKDIPPICEQCKNPMKYCRRCMKWKPIEEFATYTEKYVGRWVGEVKRVAIESYCKQCQTDKKRIHNMVQMTGVTPEERLKMIEAVGGRCAICGEAKEKMRVDHDHKTGAIRGILCNDCNLALGGFGDDPSLLSSALNYLTNSISGEN